MGCRVSGVFAPVGLGSCLGTARFLVLEDLGGELLKPTCAMKTAEIRKGQINQG